MLWDIFCRVVDNFGDMGVCWRLSADLAGRGHSVRLWTDDASSLAWMAPGALQDEWPGLRVLNWAHSCDPVLLRQLPASDVWVEAFGCEIATEFIHFFSDAPKPGAHPDPVWINLEYLSAEAYVERSHGLPSPVMHGAGVGRTKYFFYPGFTRQTGGLLREADAGIPLQAPEMASNFLAQWNVDASAGRVVSLFCYEPPALPALLAHFAQQAEPVQLLVTAGRPTQAVQALLGAQTQSGQLQVRYLPLLSQIDFDLLLRSCDLNFVRGEDSVVRALWAGAPFVWQIYPQDDGADAPKLEAFMEVLQLSPPVRALYRSWNSPHTGDQTRAALQGLDFRRLDPWRRDVLAARERLLKMDDLTSQLLHFVAKKR